MSQVAPYADPGLLNVKYLRYDTWQTVYFQRTSVIVTELVLVYALHLYSYPAPPPAACFTKLTTAT